MVKKINIFNPKLLAILYICFISLFALDVFDQEQWMLALFMHLIPSYILIGITIIAWKYTLIGGLLFVISSIALLEMSNNLIISVPPLIIGIIFIFQNYWKKYNEG
jgi:hypothetical protein